MKHDDFFILDIYTDNEIERERQGNESREEESISLNKVWQLEGKKKGRRERKVKRQEPLPVANII